MKAEPVEIQYPVLSAEARKILGIPLEKCEGDRPLEEPEFERLYREAEMAHRNFNIASAILIGFGLGIFSAAAFAILIGG